MDLKVIDQEFSVCKINNLSEIDFSDEFCFIGKTDEEISLVCSSGCVPKTAIKCDNGWRAFRIQGVLDFSLIGIMSKISGVLAGEGIGIFAVSTFNTDYILTKAENIERALSALKACGYNIIQ